MLRQASWILAGALLLAAAYPDAIAPFSAASPGGELPAGWALLTLPRIKPAEVALTAEGGATVLRVRAAAGASSVTHRLSADAARTPILSWRWKVDRVVANADLARREGDDYAARVYVSFDLPAERMTLAERVRLKLARLFYGDEVPAAALCYVWDNRHAPGTTAWNAYSSRVRMVVVSSGMESAGRWTSHTRDLAADFGAAFGAGAVPRITGVAVSADTDQTGETVTAWFGDLVLGARR